MPKAQHRALAKKYGEESAYKIMNAQKTKAKAKAKAKGKKK